MATGTEEAVGPLALAGKRIIALEQQLVGLESNVTRMKKQLVLEAHLRGVEDALKDIRRVDALSSDTVEERLYKLEQAPGEFSSAVDTGWKKIPVQDFNKATSYQSGEYATKEESVDSFCGCKNCRSETPGTDEHWLKHVYSGPAKEEDTDFHCDCKHCNCKDAEYIAGKKRICRYTGYSNCTHSICDPSPNAHISSSG